MVFVPSRLKGFMLIATLCYVKLNGRTLMLHRVKRADDIHAGKWNGLPKAPGSWGGAASSRRANRRRSA
jgi:hypothetical protein